MPASLSLLYLVLAPLGGLVGTVIFGVTTTGVDLLGGLVVATWAITSIRQDGVHGHPPAWFWPFIGFIFWVGLSSIWGPHSDYALAKMVGMFGLLLLAMAFRNSNYSWAQISEAWVLGCMVALGVLVTGILMREGALYEQVLFRGGSVRGLPFPRVSGPLGHPNVLGDYLLLSSVFLWARWPDLREQLGRWLWLIAAILFVAGVGTASAAWLGSGVALVMISVMGRGGDDETGAGDPAPDAAAPAAPAIDPMADDFDPVEVSRAADPLSSGRWIPFLLGIAIVMATVYGLFFETTLTFGDTVIRTTGIRSDIVGSAMWAFYNAPLIGVGAAPFLAEAANPLDPTGGAYLWDAHNAYVSILGQFGIIGFLFFFSGIGMLLRAVYKLPRSTRRTAILVMLISVLVNWTAVAGEEFRSFWVLVGVAGLVLVGDPEPEAVE